MKTPLLPAEARKKWQSSTIANPCKEVVKICERAPTLPNKDLVARCVAAGIAKRTASVRISRWKKVRRLAMGKKK